ncbi:uncharacterized protein LOC141881645 [Acropora palmata]|uniref:uncharacterized protein LOC141881645 n=1 Tax=Acropora palmata TaxID=6131 RepID=UPI003D9FD80C
MNHWILISAISGIVLGIVCSAPQLAHLPYEYFHELYNHYGDSVQNNIEDMKRVHEEHQEIQHRVHEKYQEHYYNIREKIQETDENYHESLEKSNEEIRSSSGTRKSVISNKVNPRIAEKEAKSFLQKKQLSIHRQKG